MRSVALVSPESHAERVDESPAPTNSEMLDGPANVKFYRLIARMGSLHRDLDAFLEKHPQGGKFDRWMSEPESGSDYRRFMETTSEILYNYKSLLESVGAPPRGVPFSQ